MALLESNILFYAAAESPIILHCILKKGKCSLHVLRIGNAIEPELVDLQS